MLMHPDTKEEKLNYPILLGVTLGLIVLAIKIIIAHFGGFINW